MMTHTLTLQSISPVTQDTHHFVFDRLNCVFTVTDQEEAGVRTSRIDQALLADHVGVDVEAYYICGPDPLIDDMQRALQALGVEDERIVTENFD